jgi:hypothetical protein
MIWDGPVTMLAVIRPVRAGEPNVISSILGTSETAILLEISEQEDDSMNKDVVTTRNVRRGYPSTTCTVSGGRIHLLKRCNTQALM